jgi:hypothetical protein
LNFEGALRNVASSGVQATSVRVPIRATLWDLGGQWRFRDVPEGRGRNIMLLEAPDALAMTSRMA